MSEKDTVDLIEKACQSVVNVNTIRVFHDLFYRVVPVQGMGSGFIINEEGYVLTNNHVISGAHEIAVTLNDGRVFQGRLEGTSRSADVAVVKIEGENLSSITLGDSDKLRVGQRVFAIGNPFGLVGGPTVTSGVISAVNRTINSEEGAFEGLVQTDAAINPGNSGGPLIDVEGKVVAINTAIIPFAQGIGFAVPINAAKSCTNDILVHGAVRKPWLGITGFTITKDVAAQYRLPVESGVFVAGVESDSPSNKVGMKKGDIIQGMNGKRIDSIEELQDMLRQKQPGDKAALTILRDLRQVRLEVTLEKMP
jgi:S1-C subfamily serine protease